MTVDGLAEERLADCALLTEDRAGWSASGHVARLKPREGVNAGLLYLACTSEVTQAQLKALATGSVVDALSDEDIRNMPIPFPSSDEAVALGQRVIEAWDQFASAAALEDQAAGELETELAD